MLKYLSAAIGWPSLNKKTLVPDKDDGNGMRTVVKLQYRFQSGSFNKNEY